MKLQLVQAYLLHGTLQRQNLLFVVARQLWISAVWQHLVSVWQFD